MNATFGKPSGALRWLGHGVRHELSKIIAFGHLAIDLAAAYGSGATHGYGPAAFDIDRYLLLIPGQAQDWNPEVADTHWAPLHYMDGFLALDPILDEGLLPFPTGTVGDILAWLRNTLSREGRQAKLNDQVFSEPDLLITAGYQNLPEPGCEERLDSQNGAAGLALVGLGAVCYWTRERCDICFRLKAPGLDRCTLHSQSKLNLGEDSQEAGQRAQSARVARKAILASPNLSEILHLRSGLATFEHAVASILWPRLVAEATYSPSAVISALELAPRVQGLLPSGFSSLPAVEQMSMLRQGLDPEEHVAFLWPQKIREAEEWLSIEAMIAPGRQTGLSQANLARVTQIRTLLEQGLPNAEIAEKLEISRSHLSHLLRRAGGQGKF